MTHTANHSETWAAGSKREAETGPAANQKLHEERYPNGCPDMQFVYAGNPPFEVSYVTLKDSERDALAKDFTPYVYTIKDLNPATITALARTVKEWVPDRLKRALTALEDKDTSSVVVLRNVPEVLISDTSEVYRQPSFASLFPSTLLSCLGKEPGMVMQILRDASDAFINGDKIHKHGTQLACLSVMLSDGACTRFIDWYSILKEASQDAELRALSIHVSNCGLNEACKMTLAEAADDNNITKLEGHTVFISPAEQEADCVQRFERLVARHSHKIHVGPGDVVLWSDRGRIYHQAMVTKVNSPEVPQGLTRVAFVVSGEEEMKTAQQAIA